MQPHPSPAGPRGGPGHQPPAGRAEAPPAVPSPRSVAPNPVPPAFPVSVDSRGRASSAAPHHPLVLDLLWHLAPSSPQLTTSRSQGQRLAPRCRNLRYSDVPVGTRAESSRGQGVGTQRRSSEGLSAPSGPTGLSVPQASGCPGLALMFTARHTWDPHQPSILGRWAVPLRLW